MEVELDIGKSGTDPFRSIRNVDMVKNGKNLNLKKKKLTWILESDGVKKITTSNLKVKFTGHEKSQSLYDEAKG